MEINGTKNTTQQTRITPLHVGGAAGSLVSAGLVPVSEKAVAPRNAQPHARITPEAARELLKQHQGKLGGIMTAALQSMAGPVKRPAPQK